MVLHYRRASWRPLQRGDDALLDLGPHLVDLALLLTGARPLAVRAHATRDRAGHRARDVARPRCRSNARPTGPHHELVEVRERGRPARRPRHARRPARGVAGRLPPGAHPLVRSLTRQLEAYGRALRGEDPGPLATAGEGAAVMRVLDAARRSDAVGGETVRASKASPSR